MFGCPVCNKPFSRKYSVKGHILTVHEKQRPYPCDICPKKLSTKSSLKRHKTVIHENRKPYACDSCNKKFATKYVLKRHKINKHLFEVVENRPTENKRFRFCDNRVTFRIKPIPENMSSLVWFNKVFEGILQYFKKTYSPGDNDMVGLTIHNSAFPDRDAFISMRRHKDLDVETVIKTISNVCQSNTSFNITGDLDVCYKQIKM